MPTATPAPHRAASVLSSPSPTPAPDRQPAVVAPAPAPSVTGAVASPAPSVVETPSPVASAEAALSEDPPADDATVDADIEPAVDWRAFVPTDIADHLATMDRAARESNCGVPWQLLAAIARVESNFGRNMATSSAGAIGYGQFLPSSWRAFGSEGNAYDYRDALPAIALYLCQSGLERDPRSALFAYNHADWYVDLVLDLAVRYDRMAPGAPIPEVLNTGPADQAVPSMRYAPGRDLTQQTHQRTTDGGLWLGVPWQGRTQGGPVSMKSDETATLAMLRGAFGVKGAAPAVDSADAARLTAFGNSAWAGGLLPLPGPTPGWTL